MASPDDMPARISATSSTRFERTLSMTSEADTATTPVQTMPFPITVINLTTAETLGLTIPQSLLDTENVEAIR